MLVVHVRCGACGAEEPFPFKCAYCGLYFCGEHRLPENHACTKYAYALPPRQYTTTADGSMSYFPGSRRRSPLDSEAVSFAVGAVLVWLVGVSMLGFEPSNFGLVVNSVLFVVAFLGHEYAHKLAAHHYGLWAEFRLNPLGALLTALSIVLPIKFIAPGAVMLGGYSDERTLGIVAAAGPLVNIAMSAVLGPLVFLPSGGYLWPAFYVSSFISVFNLIPVAILDGKKVFDWNKAVWGAMFAISAVFLYVAWVA
ncbi:MAG TPA: AN1-type zinc finger domain-containing protein [Conexivisphaerales archaeon]|nr:AN1-type zinc finger domain-containing protein [Conexivisphaerales archaeon]